MNPFKLFSPKVRKIHCRWCSVFYATMHITRHWCPGYKWSTENGALDVHDEVQFHWYTGFLLSPNYLGTVWMPCSPPAVCLMAWYAVGSPCLGQSFPFHVSFSALVRVSSLLARWGMKQLSDPYFPHLWTWASEQKQCTCQRSSLGWV